MDKMVKPQIAILNLAGELCEELSNYFVQKQIVIVDPERDSASYKWTHILTKDMHDFTQLNATYDTALTDVRIISLSAVDDLQHFIASNGKLILDEVWMHSSLGGFILDKFFQEYGGISLGDNYPTFKEKGSFIITNPFNTGEYLDRLVYNAFLDGVSALSIKTSFDHLVMYLTGLKTKGKLGMPIEVTYGNFNDIFGVQFHFFTKDLIMEDVTASLSSKISKRSEEYLLNVAINSSDFFDFTLLKEVNKTVITALWSKDSRIKIENRGLLFNEVTASASITNYPTEGATSFQMNNPFLEDFSDKIVLPASVSEAPAEIKIIHGTEVEDEIITLVKGRVEEEEKVFRISGGKFDVDTFAVRISSGIDDPGKNDNILKIKSLKNELPHAIKDGLQKFTRNLNKTTDAISEEDLKNFKEFEVPKIIKEATKKVDTEFKATAEAVFSSQTVKSGDPSFAALNVENDSLKTKIRTLLSEVKILKDSKLAMAEAQAKAKLAAEAAIQSVQTLENSDTALKIQLMQKMQEQISLNEVDTKKLAALMERESRFLKDAKENEIQLKKLQIETVQKESLFGQEIEKLNRLVKSKDLVLTKTKEGLSKIVEQKDKDLQSTTDKLNQASKALASNQTQNQANMIRELERKVVNHEKMIEIYKNKMTHKPATKSDDETSKEEFRRLQLLNTTMKNQLDMSKKEMIKYQDRIASDSTALNTLKAEKNKLEALLKKVTTENKREEAALAANTHTDQDYKNLQAQLELLETTFKENQNRYRDMEGKLQDALRAQKKDIVSDDQSTKGKTAHLEGNVRKLTQDLVEAKNHLAEMKKETNKLRQEKTALQNLADKMKKEAEKSKAAAPKKTVGGKAA